MSVRECDLLVVGGGPAGFWASLVGAVSGLRIVLVEESQVGGTCLNRGCVPLVTVLNYMSAVRLVQKLSEEASGVRLEGLTVDIAEMLRSVRTGVVSELSSNMRTTLENLGVEVVTATAYLTGRDSARVGGQALRFREAVVATGLSWGAVEGARPASDITQIDRTPTSVLVIGGNAFGVSVASLFSLAGTEVTLVDSGDELLPDFDREVVEFVMMEMLDRGVRIFTRTNVAGIAVKGRIREVGMVNPDGRVVGEFDEVIDASTYKPRVDALKGVEVGLRGGYVAVDEYMRTSIQNIYAAGDITGVMPYAHVAIIQGIIAGVNAGGGNLRVSYRAVPRYLFAYPEAFSVGLTEAEARGQGYDVVVARQKLSSNAVVRAGGGGGVVKVVLDPKYGILGVHCAGTGISELINEAVLTLALESTPEAVMTAFLAHPTVGEVLREALVQVVRL